jgi:serine/threonine-protein kinase
MIEQLGKYRIDAILGKGAMGVVYKAFDPYIERVVALKTIRKELFSDSQQEDLISRFKNEAQAAGRLNHQNIVMVYDYGEDSESAYIAMEFVEGAPLNTLIQPGQPTALPRIIAWMSDLLLALEYAHLRGVVHRDIKPANLMITANARVKVSDFGIARIDSSTLTQTGSMIGTPSYMSPEQYRGETVDGRSDVFSAGVLLYQLLSGERPFVGSASAVMQQILNVNPAPPSQVMPALGCAWDRVVERATAKAVADRFATAREFLDALTAVVQGQDPTAAADLTAVDDSDRTVLAAGLRLPDPAPTGRSGAGLETGGSSSNINTMTPWKLAALPELEAILSRQIGPVAKVLLKKVAAKAEGMDEMCNLLLPHIPSDLGRLQFQEAVTLLKKKLDATGTGSGIRDSRTSLGTGGTGATGLGATGIGATGMSAGRSAVRVPVPFDDAWADAMAQRLTVLVGPIARVVAKRAARQTRDKAEFLQLLAEQIESAPERARFLAEAGAA